MLSLPFVLIGVLLILAAVTYLLRGWDRGVALTAAGVVGLMALLLWFMDFGVTSFDLPLLARGVDLNMPLERLGFAWQVPASTTPILAASFGLTAVAFLLSARVSQGHTFVPIALVLLAGYTGVITMVSAPLPPVLMVPLFLVGLSCVSAFVLQAGRLQHPAGPLRMIVPPVLAFPLFVLSAWYLDQAPLNPQDNSMQVAAAQLMMLGMLLLLAPVPLHGVQPTAMQSAPPVVAALVLLLYQFTVVHLYFGLQVDYPFLLEYSSLPTWFAAAGAATAIWGGIAAAGTNHAGRLWGYAALHDWGLLIMIMGIPGPATLPLALFVLNLRAISMLTTAAGLSVLEQHAGGLEPRRLQGAGTRLPWNSAAVLLGGLGLAGFPLSAGFTGHWAAIQVIANVDWRPAVLVLLASGGAIFGFIRLARTLFGPLENRALVREQPMSALVAVVALLLSVGLAVAPQLLDQPIARALLAFGG